MSEGKSHAKKTLFFAVAVVVSFLAANDRWGDSAHSSGFISLDGGSVRHTRPLDGDYGKYSIVATARVRTPFQGDARVVLEGSPELDHEIYLSRLSLDLGFRNRPEFKDRTVYGLKPGDKVNFWVVITNPPPGGINGRYTLALYDTRTGQPVFGAPMVFKTQEIVKDAEADCH